MPSGWVSPAGRVDLALVVLGVFNSSLSDVVPALVGRFASALVPGGQPSLDGAYALWASSLLSRYVSRPGCARGRLGSRSLVLLVRLVGHAGRALLGHPRLNGDALVVVAPACSTVRLRRVPSGRELSSCPLARGCRRRVNRFVFQWGADPVPALRGWLRSDAVPSSVDWTCSSYPALTGVAWRSALLSSWWRRSWFRDRPGSLLPRRHLVRRTAVR